MHKAGRLVNQRAGGSLLCFTFDRISTRSRHDVIERRSRPMVWWVRGHSRWESDPRQIEIITPSLQVGNRSSRAEEFFDDSRCGFGRLLEGSLFPAFNDTCIPLAIKRPSPAPIVFTSPLIETEVDPDIS